jgi:hypothetical protein
MVERSAGYLEKKEAVTFWLLPLFCGVCACDAARGGQQDRLAVHWQEIGMHSLLPQVTNPLRGKLS